MYFGNLSEELILIVLDPKTGKVKKRNTQLRFGLIGGLVMELILQGRIAIIENRILSMDENLTGDELLDEVLNRVKAEENTLSAYSLIRMIKLQIPNIVKLMLNRLVNKGLLQVETKKILRIFKRDRFYLTKPNTKDLIKNNIQRIVIEGEESDHHTLGLLSLMYATNNEKEIFSEEELETYLNAIRSLVSGDEIGKSIVEAINNTAEALMRSLIVNSAY